MPYHVWQVPDEELLVPTEEREAEDTKQSAELVNQLVNIRKRFAKVRRREGEVSGDNPQADRRTHLMSPHSSSSYRNPRRSCGTSYKPSMGSSVRLVHSKRQSRRRGDARVRLPLLGIENSCGPKMIGESVKLTLQVCVRLQGLSRLLLQLQDPMQVGQRSAPR